MKNILFRILMCFFLYSCSVIQNNKTYTEEGFLSWEDNFEGNNLNLENWSKIPRGQYDWNNTMSFDENLFDLRNGKLILRGIINQNLSDSALYLTGGIYTKGKKSFNNGRIEIKAKLNSAKGAWPAFWMLPLKAKWPHGGEIDIMERLNSDAFVYQTVHTHYTHNLKIQDPKSSSIARINPQDFNVFAVELIKDKIIFYVNGKKNFEYPRIQSLEIEKKQFPFDLQKFYLLLDMQLGGKWVGDVSANDLPVEIEIDWVRFYQYE